MPDADGVGGLPRRGVEARPCGSMLLRRIGCVGVELVDGRPVLNRVRAAGAEEQFLPEQPGFGVHAEFAQHARHGESHRHPSVGSPPLVDLHADVKDDQFTLMSVRHASRNDSSHDRLSSR